MNGYNIYTKIKIPWYIKVALRRLNNQHIQQILVTSCLSFRRKQKLERTSKLQPSLNYFHFLRESLDELLLGQAAGVLPWLPWLLWNKKDQTEEKAVLVIGLSSAAMVPLQNLAKHIERSHYLHP